MALRTPWLQASMPANKNCAAGTWPWGNLTLAAGIDAMLQAHGLWGTLAAGIHACW